MRLLFVSAPFRGLTRKLTRFQRVFGHLENGLVFVLHSWIINVNWLQYSLSVWNMMVSSSIAGLCGCQALTQFGGLSPLPNKMWRLLRRTLLDHPNRKYGLSKRYHMARRITIRTVWEDKVHSWTMSMTITFWLLVQSRKRAREHNKWCSNEAS